MKNILKDFKAFTISKKQLEEGLGGDIWIRIPESEIEIVNTSDVISAIKKYRSREITQGMLLDWVNTLWFADLFCNADNQCDSIASVMDLLEELDEEGVAYTDNDYARMIEALENNTEFSL